MISVFQVILRLVVSLLLGGIVGLQREASERPAGFRTHVLVCLGSTLFTLVSFFPFGGVNNTDPTRIAAQVVTGIGFLGAGTIIRRENLVIGLTTAASLWTVAAVGVAVGAGYYSAAVLTTLLIMAVLTIFKQLELRVVPPAGERMVHMTVTNVKRVMEQVQGTLADKGIAVKSLGIHKSQYGRSVVDLELDVGHRLDTSSVVLELAEIEGVEEVDIEPSRKPPGEAFG
ncbi:MAG: MgtC/SapB family protein [Candidatus Aquicultorales bacterium]